MEDITLGKVVVWLIVGALAGSLAARVVYNRKRGLGFTANLLVGLAGAVVGGFLFGLFDIGPLFEDVVLTLDDIIAAFVGSLILLLLVWFIRRA